MQRATRPSDSREYQMRYQGSAVANEEYIERGYALPQERPSFEVVSGGGLDARARRGVAPEFLARVKAVVACALVFFALGACRVALTSAAVAALQGNATLKSQISEAKTTNDSLMIERSALSSNARISRIATQNLGMVLSTDTETVTIGAADAASADAAQDASADAAPSDGRAAQADGDAAQSASEDASVQGVA